MIIDTDKATNWVKNHTVIVVPIGLGFLSWYAATRWQVAIYHNETAMMVFYFFVSALTGVASAISAGAYLASLDIHK